MRKEGGEGELGGWNNIMSLGNCLIFLQRAQRGIRKQTASASIPRLRDEEGCQSIQHSLEAQKLTQKPSKCVYFVEDISH